MADPITKGESVTVFKGEYISGSTQERVEQLEQEVKDLKNKLNEVIKITKRYYDFWLHGTALEPIYKKFIDELEQLEEK